MKKTPFLLIAVLFSVSFLTIAQSTNSTQKPNIKDTEDWIIEKFNKYSKSSNTVNRAISHKVTLYDSYENYQFTFEDDKLIITYTTKGSQKFTNGYTKTVTNNTKSIIYITDIDKISFVTDSNEDHVPKILQIQLKKNKFAKQVVKQFCIDNNNIKESNDYSLDINSEWFGFNIDGESDLENRLNSAFNNLKSSLTKKETY